MSEGRKPRNCETTRKVPAEGRGREGLVEVFGVSVSFIVSFLRILRIYGFTDGALVALVWTF